MFLDEGPRTVFHSDQRVLVPKRTAVFLEHDRLWHFQNNHAL